MALPMLGLVGTAFATCVAIVFFRKKGDPYQEIADFDAATTDPGLLRKHSTNRRYNVNGIVYPSIRTFFSQHPQAEKLPTRPTPLPLLVFIHGLGGSVAQFNSLLTNLVNVGPCLAIDLPGCGLSTFEPTSWDAYRLDNLVALIAEAIAQHRDAEHDQKVVLISHSLGCSLATLLTSESSPLRTDISSHIIGLIAICPRAKAITDKQISNLKLVPYVPTLLFNAFRKLDRRGGIESASVHRFVGKDADLESKRLQLRFNEQSRTPVFLRFVAGWRPQGSLKVTLPGPEMWSHISVPLLCIAGEDDRATPASNIDLIADSLREHQGVLGDHEIQDALQMSVSGQPDAKTTVGDAVHKPPAFVFKSAILPSPAGHGLMYSTGTIRVVSGLVQGFLATHVDQRLSIGWQLQHLTTEGKWDVKNLVKWQRIHNVSEPIAGIFRAMKTLREVDEVHTPKAFAKTWGAKAGLKKGIAVVIDISHDSPVYDPKGLEEGGIEYHKFPTVSKLPPTTDEVRGFISLVDSLRTKIKEAGSGKDDGLIAIHCHYGFNRSGAFIVSYLVERLGYRLQDALEEFAEKRPPGIKHEHFINELHVRYAVGLKKAPTWH